MHGTFRIRPGNLLQRQDVQDTSARGRPEDGPNCGQPRGIAGDPIHRPEEASVFIRLILGNRAAVAGPRH